MPKHKSGKRSGKGQSGSRETNSLVSKVWSVNAMAEPSAGTRLDNIPFNLYQTSDKGVLLTTSSGAEVDASLSFQFADFGNASAMSGMFDQYRIREVEVWVTPTYQDYLGGNSAARYAVVVDYDNVNTVSFATAQEYTNCSVAPATTGVYMKFRPHVGMTVGSNSSAANVVSPWIDTAVPSVTHYGIKFSAPATNVTYTLGVRYRAHIQLRNMN
jgi:hypothetical protein